MKNRKRVGFCKNCRKKTVQTFIEKETTGAFRLFEAILTLGWAEADNGDKCQCTNCGEINTID